jgi:tungstate transport system substrate-binding protein
VVPGSPKEEAKALRRFLASEEAARLIEGLQVEGTPLFKALRGRCIIPPGGSR